MNIHKNKKTRSGFTLIELLTVIAIIGILAGILIPTIGLVRKNASKAKSSSNMRQIGLAYNSFAITGPRIRSIAAGAFSATANTRVSVFVNEGLFADRRKTGQATHSNIF